MSGLLLVRNFLFGRAFMRSKKIRKVRGSIVAGRRSVRVRVPSGEFCSQLNIHRTAQKTRTVFAFCCVFDYFHCLRTESRAYGS